MQWWNPKGISFPLQLSALTVQAENNGFQSTACGTLQMKLLSGLQVNHNLLGELAETLVS